MMQSGMFDWQTRFEQLDNGGDPLVRLNAVVPWETFRKLLQNVRNKDRTSPAGRKPFDVIVMFKILIVQSLYNLSDDQTEFQIRDRISFMRFLGFSVSDTVPDAKTIWLFRQQLTEAGVIEKAFDRFDRFLRDHGFEARKGQIVDASIVSAPKQRNSREDNKKIKDGEVPDDWDANKKRQKDTDARWTKKNGKTFYGYKNHVSVDVEHKLIRRYAVTDAAVHDSQVFEELLDAKNRRKEVWADSAYRSAENLKKLKKRRLREQLQRKGCRHKPLTEKEKQGNTTRSKTRSRIEHVFGVQAQRAGNLLMRAIGLVRTRAKIGLRNLAYNLDRYSLLAAL